jgi:hypothetical protein
MKFLCGQCHRYPIHARGMCLYCCNAFYKNRDFDRIYQRNRRCEADGCEGKALGRGLCNKHYMQAYRAERKRAA